MLSSITVTSLADNTTVDGSTAGSGADTITFAPSLFTGGDQSITLNLFDTGLDSTEFGATAFIVSTPITINGPTGDNGLTIARASDNSNKFRLFHVRASGDLTLDSLTLSGGLAMGGNGAPGSAQGGGLGGAVFNQGALQIHRSTVSGNVAIGGNGGALSGAAPTPNGGGGDVGADGNLYASGGPNAGPPGLAGGFGGGGGGQRGPGTPSSGGFGGGGGAANYDGGPSFGGFGGGNGMVGAGSGGGAGMGGAIFNESGTVTITNSTLGLNSATGGTGNTNGQGLGGAVFTRNGSVTILNSTFSENTAAEGGGAIFAVSDSNSGTGFTGGNATVAINNTILANTAGGASDFAAATLGTGTNSLSGVGNLIESNAASGTHTGTFTGTIVSSDDPMLVDLGDNGGPTQTFALNAGSPAIDAGDSVVGAAAGDFDQRGSGFDRLVGNGIDIGAFEVQAAASTGTLSAVLSNGNLTITDTDGTKNNSLLVSVWMGMRAELVITDTNEAFDVAPMGGVLSNGNKTLTIPADWVTDTLTINAAGGSDTIDIGALNATLIASLTVNGGSGDDTINFSGDTTFATDKSLDVDLQNDDTAPGVDFIGFAADANVVLSGVGAATLTASKYIALTTGSSLVTENGALTIAANRQATPTSGDFSGVYVDGSLIEVTGSGALDISGHGGDGASGFQRGVSILNGGTIRGGSSGTNTVTGFGGAGTGVGNNGVAVVGSGSQITSNGGAVAITGIGGGTGTSAQNRGVQVALGGLISSGTGGTVTVTGTGGAGSGDFNTGVAVNDAGSQITSGGGAVEITGTGGGTGTSANNRGVSVTVGGVISAGNSGTVTVTGTGGTGSRNANHGVAVTNSGSKITSGGGAIEVTGTGGGTDVSSQNIGVSVSTGEISSSNGAPVTVTGTGGAGLGPQQRGVMLVAARITSDGGAILVTGRGGTGSGNSNEGVYVLDDSAITTTNADLEIVGIVQGSGDSDAITVSGAGAVIAVNGMSGHLTLRGTSNTTVDSQSLLIQNGGRVTSRDGDSGVSLGLSANATLDVTLQATLGARAIEVDGTVDLGGATLLLRANAVNAIILDNDDTDSVSNTFNGFPEGTVLTNFQNTGFDVRTTYIGVDGNDVVLELVPANPASTAVSLTNGTLVVEDVDGGDSDDALTITLDRSNMGTPVVRITDPNLRLGITGTIVGSTLSDDGHTVTVPYDAVLSLHVLAQGGNDSVTLAAAGSGAFQHEVLIDAGAGHDTVTLDSSLRGRFEGTLTANGDDGNDTLTAVAIAGAGSFRVTFTGGNGDDTLTGGEKNDTLNGGLGNDVLYGLGGADSLDGGAGDDLLDGGASNDTLNGGTGIDRARRKSDVSFAVTNTELQELNGSTLISFDTLSGIETVSLTGGVSANRFDLTAFSNTAVAIVEGGGGNDTVLGSEGTDSITTGSGIDVIDGRGGNDTIASGDGADVVQGGLGNDSISGDGGNDSLVGGAGADLLFGGSGKDTLTGNEGNDTLSGGTGSDMLSEAGDVNFVLTNSSLTGLGTDQISAFESALLTGGNGPNIIDASAATFSVLMNGGPGADILTGGSENDSLNGGTGNDTLYGLGGQDLLFGSFGNDLLDGGASNDSLVGGDGIDAARRKNNTDFRVDNTGMFELLGTQVIATDTFNSIETVSITGGVSANRIDLSAFTNTGTATIQGSGGNDTVIGSDGLDVITTTSGADVIDGRGGADTILSGDGADSIHGGDGNDNLDGQGGNDTVLGDAGNDNLGGGAGSDQIDGGAGRNRLVENVEGNVTIVGTQLTSSVPGNNDSIQNVIAITLRGGTGNNLLDARLSSVPVQLQGNDGDDTLLGSSGRDLLQGGAGNDVLSGGDSIDTIDGGLGTDTFFESGNSDFAVTGVKIARGGGSTTESVSNIEGIVLIGGVGNNALDASRASVPVTLLGGAGNDMLAGGSLADVLIGGNRASSTNGLDTLNGLAGNDQFDNDPADTRTRDAGDQVLANIFAQLPSWIDAL